MRKNLVPHLRANSAGHHSELSLSAFEQSGDDISEGILTAQNGYWYPILNGVPCFLSGPLRPDLAAFEAKYGLKAMVGVPTDDSRASGQLLTSRTFSDKWSRFTRYGFEPAHQIFLREWYCRKLGVRNESELRQFYHRFERILEVGPGSGFNTRDMAESTDGEVFAVDISQAAHTTYENTRELPNCHVIQADLMDTPFSDDYFDFIIADGVLHHTPDTRRGFECLLAKVKRGGRFYFYVYRRMGAARQFCDDYLRRALGELEPEACYQACEGLTELGRELSHINARITLKKGVPLLGIPPGTHDVQRLLYYNFVKCFWNDAFDFETNNMVNFDWYHPHHAWQHTEQEVKGWLDAAGIRDYSFNASNPNGISVLLAKP